MALYLKKELEDSRSLIGVWQITETEEELRELASVPSDEMEEISFIGSESMRKQRLAVRALLCELFGEKVYLSHHDNGKPYLENSVTNISITHTAKYVAVILNDNENVGIDIESLARDFSVVERKALSEEEIDDLDDDKRNEQLAIYWCARRPSTNWSQRILSTSQSRSRSSASAPAAKVSWMPPSSTRTATRRTLSLNTSPSTTMCSSGW